ncbi:DUF2877 domain-containing protein [Carnobacterium jeotgali]|uniref:DUF2877 domain-containing protein n=1 Tax=Carnobacterium jeotgali TaxID=545534 RepID=UPI00388E0E69
MIRNKRETKSNFLSLYLKECLQLGKVHSIFENSLNIQFPVGLVHVGQIGMPLSPFGCLIEPKDFQKIHDQCQLGDIVRFKQGQLFLYTQKEVIKIALDQFEMRDLTIPKLEITAQELKENLLYQMLEEAIFSLSIETGLPLNETIKKGLQSLTDPQLKAKELKDEEIIRLLIGRGIGLTPSGDDILIGYTFARVLFQKKEEWQSKLADTLQKVKTTAISEAYFNALLHGSINENFLHLARLFAEKDREKINDELQNLKRFGHTSGTDTLYGFTLGLQYVQREMER